MNKTLMVIATCASLSSGCVLAQSTGGQSTSGYDMATARNIPMVTEGMSTPFNRNSLIDNHLPGVERGRKCAVEARKMLSRLGKENYADAQRSFSPTVRDLVTTERLERMWTSLESSYGTPSGSYGRSVLVDSPAGGYSAIAIDLSYPQAKLTAHVLCNVANKVTDFKVTKDDQVASN